MQINAFNTQYPSPQTFYDKESKPLAKNAQQNQEYNTQQAATQSPLATQETQSPTYTKETQISPEKTSAIVATQEDLDKDTQGQSKIDENPHPERITYGLKILELMSNEEYRAFVFASQGLSESQKMLMAQGLYRFTDFYQGRKDGESGQIDATMQQQLKAFGAQNSQIESFINRYKNAYAQILSEEYLG